MNILAIDPAQRTGFAHSSGPCGVWPLGSDPAGRLERLDEHIRSAVAKYGADVIAYESATFGSRHVHTMRRHNELAGVIELVAKKLGLQCWSYPPPQWKAIALTSGRLDKAGVKRALRIIYGIELVDNDIADAVGILKAAMKGPPPEPKRKAKRRAEKALKARQPTLFGGR